MTASVQPLRVAILSTAHLHADSYASALSASSDAVLTFLWDDDSERGHRKAEEYGTAFESDLDTALEDCDAVVICSENSRHRELTERAAAVGKHVLCEKPLAVTSEDARAMIAACQNAGVLLGTAFPVRHSGPAFEMRDAVQSSTLGQVLMIRGTNRGTNPGGWFVDPALSGGGAVTDHTVHVADVVRFITGEEITSVYAEADTSFYPDLPVEDCALLIMELSGGGFLSLDPSWSRPNKAFPTWGDVHMQLTGTGGVATFNYGAQHNKLYSNTRVRAAEPGWGDNPDALMIEDFLAAIRDNRPPLATGEDGLRAVEVVEAAYSSIHSGMPVPVRQA
ncbi:MAG: Gfo/Idh/MocA family oxidoreductase [Chloroflexota bacterium]|nr:Gfo/Idh/MocA family oxidoreductase [Chloroflexota bacterium]